MFNFNVRERILAYYKPKSEKDLQFLLDDFFMFMTEEVSDEQIDSTIQVIDYLLPIQEAFNVLKDEERFYPKLLASATDDNFKYISLKTKVNDIRIRINNLVTTCKAVVDPIWVPSNHYDIDSALVNFQIASNLRERFNKDGLVGYTDILNEFNRSILKDYEYRVFLASVKAH
jgi:hypothetical protein